MGAPLYPPNLFDPNNNSPPKKTSATQMEEVQSVLSEAVSNSNYLLHALYQNLILNDDVSNIPSSNKSTRLAVDASMVIMWAVVITFGITFSRKYLFEPLGGIVMKSNDASKCRRFADSFTELVFYSFFTFASYKIYWDDSDRQWIWPSNLWWDNHYVNEHIVRNDLRAIYLLDTARYIACLISVVFLEHKRKDSTEMFVHHVSTLIVGWYAYWTNHHRCGSIVKLVMDPADVPLHLAKACKYAGDGRKSKFFIFMADRFFELFAICFFFTRLGMFAYIIWSSTFEGRIKCNWTAYQNFALSMLYILYVLQWYWFSLIIKVRSASTASRARSVRSARREQSCALKAVPSI